MMNNDDPILTELRKISAWADMQRKATKWALIAVAVFIPALVIFALLMDRRVNTKLENVATEGAPDWYDVDQNVRRGDFDKALQIGEKLIVKTPLYPEAHRRLAGAYLAAGNVEKARKHYAEAFRLLPSEENEKLLAAIDRRIRAENPQPDGAASAASPHR
jgi:tetratricopeptide (TPR) repeat protein